MSEVCVDCGASIEMPEGAIEGEIVGCPDCGLDCVVVKNESGSLSLQELTIEGEDWGE